MIHLIKFNLPEERNELTLAVNGPKYWSALWDFKEQIRNWYKYQDRETIGIEELRDAWLKILSDNNVDLDEVE